MTRKQTAIYVFFGWLYHCVFETLYCNIYKDCF